MKKRNIFFGVVFLGIIGIGAITLFTVLNFMPSNPLEGCDQFVLVLAKTQKSKEAVKVIHGVLHFPAQLFSAKTVWHGDEDCTKTETDLMETR